MLPSPLPTSRSGLRTSGNQRRQRRRVDYEANPGTLLPVQPIGSQVSLEPRPLLPSPRPWGTLTRTLCVLSLLPCASGSFPQTCHLSS